MAVLLGLAFVVAIACEAGPGPSVVSEAEAIATARLGIVRELPRFRGATVTDAREELYRNALDTFAFRTEPEPHPDQPVWLITLVDADAGDVTVVVDATDGHVIFWSEASP